MVTNNHLLLNVVITYTERYLVSGVSVESLSEIYNPDFLLKQSPDEMGKDSKRLSKEGHIDFVELHQNLPEIFIEVDGILINLSFIEEISPSAITSGGAIICKDGMIYSISEEQILELLSQIKVIGLNPEWLPKLEEYLAEKEQKKKAK